MPLHKLKESLSDAFAENGIFNVDIPVLGELQIYYNSIQTNNKGLFFIAKRGIEKRLYILFNRNEDDLKFEGDVIDNGDPDLCLKRCPLNTKNRKAIQDLFDFTKPVTVGMKNSFGFGDRIGLGNAGHIQSLNGSDFFPVLAQQSIRELTRTGRSPNEVMDAAVWAVFQEGHKSGFSADADHLKTTDDIDLMVKAGYRIFTFDPGEFVENNADIYDEKKLLDVLSGYPWKELDDSLSAVKERYLKNKIAVNDQQIRINEIDLLKAYAKYGRSLLHVKKLHDHLKFNYPDYDSEVEISVDETDSVTSIFEHYFIASELTRLKVGFVSLAPRFVGSFEKGIDYKGDIKLFEDQYKKHIMIAEHFGNYKISLHSGSDKFSVYNVIGKLKKGFVHIKTAGTSYLEALKVVAIKQPGLFREIFDFSRKLYEIEKRTYHVSADLNKIRETSEYSDDELADLFISEDARQVLHVTFGKVLTEQNDHGKYLFKEKIVECLKHNESIHYEILISHFHKHLDPFK